MKPITCEQFQDMACHAISGDLPAGVMKSLSDHADECAGCAASFARFTAYVGGLSSEPTARPTTDESAALQIALHNLMKVQRKQAAPVLPRSLPVFLVSLLIVYMGIVGALVWVRIVPVTEIVPGWLWPVTLACFVMLVALTTIVPITVSMRHLIAARHWRS